MADNGHNTALDIGKQVKKRCAEVDEKIEIIKRRRVDSNRIATTPISTITQWLKGASSIKTRESLGILSSEPDTIFSDAEVPSSPPSSPPSLSACTILKPSKLIRIHDPVPEICMNAGLVQAQINTGTKLQTTCRICGMTFVKACREDRLLHDKFHQRALHGIELGKPFLKSVEAQTIWRSGNEASIVVIDSSEGFLGRRKVREVLDMIDAELGAVHIPDIVIWPKGTKKRDVLSLDVATIPCYRTFLYLSKTSCVGLCLVKKINLAFESVSEQENSDRVELGSKSRPASLGISRIWSSKHHRKIGIATTLLDAAMRSPFPNSPSIDKSRIAFSQPTSNGTALARRWFDKEDGWLVYVE